MEKFVKEVLDEMGIQLSSMEFEAVVNHCENLVVADLARSFGTCCCDDDCSEEEHECHCHGDHCSCGHNH